MACVGEVITKESELSLMKERKAKEISEVYSSKINGPVLFSIDGVDINITGGQNLLWRLRDLEEYLSDVMAENHLDTITCILEDAVTLEYVTVSVQQLRSLIKQMLHYGVECTQKHRLKLIEIKECTSIDDVTLITWES